MTSFPSGHPAHNPFLSGPITRRGFLKRAVVAGIGVPTIAGLIAACEADEDDDVATDPETDDDPDDDDVAAEPETDDETADEEDPTDDEDPTDIEQDDEFMRAPEPEPQYGGILRGAWGITVSHFDHHQGGGGNLWHTYDNLIQLDMGDGLNTLIGDLAESWDISDDGVTYTFHAREGVSFHDGTPFSADDIVATFDRIVNPPEGISIPLRDKFFAVSEINLINEYSMEFVLEHAWAPFIQVFVDRGLPIYSKQHLEDNDYDLREVITPGTGAFIHQEYQTAEVWTFERNPDYYNPNLPYLDGLELIHVPDWIDRGTAVLTDQADFSWNVAREMYEEAMEQPDEFGGVRLPHFGLAYAFLINNQQEPFDDPRVRRAIHLAVSRQNLIEAFSRQELITMNRWVSHANNYSMPIEEFENLPGYREDKEEDIAEAQRLLEDAGYPDGFEATLMTADVASHQQIMGPAFQDELVTSLNIRTEIQAMERALLTDNLDRGDYDIQLHTTFGTTMPDPEGMWREFLVTDATQNRFGYSNQDFDALIEQLQVEDDDDERERLVHQGMDILDEDPPFFLIGFADHHPIWRSHVHGVAETWAHTQWMRVTTAWLSDRD